MKRRILFGVLFLSLAAILLPATVPAYAAITVEPGVTAGITITPTAGTGATTVDRTIPLVNTNVDTTTVYPLGGTVTSILTGNATTLTGPFTVTVPGARTEILKLGIPANTSFVAGSLTINGVAQADPTVASNAYSLTLTLPANSTTTVKDKVQVSPLP